MTITDQELDNHSKVLDESAIPDTQAAPVDSDGNTSEAEGDKLEAVNELEESIETLEEDAPKLPPTRVVVKQQPLHVNDPLKKRGFRFSVDGWAIEVYDVKKSRKRFIRILGRIEDPSASVPVIVPPKVEDVAPLLEGSNITIEGWCYRVVSARPRGRRFVKRLGVVMAES